MIVTVTLNPTLDKTLSVPRLEPGEVHRARFVRQDLGGKGINVSRALRALGVPSKLMGFLAGSTGAAMRSGLLAAGYDIDFIEVAGETRQNLTLLDESTGVYTKINEPGHTVRPADLVAFESKVGAAACEGDLWAFCGSLPPGAPPDFYAALARSVQARRARALLDTSGEALRLGLAARPYAIKPNSEEAAEALGRPVRTDEEHLRAARDLQALGIPVVALTRGAAGLVLAAGDDLVVATPPGEPVRSPVGAGDAALAGLIWAITQQRDAAEMARRAVACGTAAAMQEGTGVGELALVQQLAVRVTVRR